MKPLPPTGATVIVATCAAVIATVAVPLIPSEVALTVTAPACTAVMVAVAPFAETVARVGSERLQAIERPGTELPVASRGVAEKVVFAPTTTEAVLGETVMLVTC